jgi:hypothetical protein
MRRSQALAVAVLLAAVIGGLIQSHGAASAHQEIEPQETIEGRLIALASSVRFDPADRGSVPSVTLLLLTDGGEVLVTLAPDADVLDQSEMALLPGQLPPQSLLRVLGRRTSASGLEASRVQVVDAPAVQDPPSP